jgi:hypothetical protein
VFQHLCSSICVSASVSICVSASVFQHLCSSIYVSASVSICVSAFVFQHLRFSICVSASVFQHLCSSICVLASVVQRLCSSICVPASVFQHLCSSISCACSITNRLPSMTTLTFYVISAITIFPSISNNKITNRSMIPVFESMFPRQLSCHQYVQREIQPGKPSIASTIFAVFKSSIASAILESVLNHLLL